MKRKSSVVNERRDRILEILQEHNIAKIEELARMLSVSELTIRRDLTELEKQNKLERFFGGACLTKSNLSFRNNYQNFKSDNRYVNAIAACAASLVEENDIIFLNTSVTALSMIPYIMKRVTILTNNANAINVECPPWVTILLTGGELQGVKKAMTGEFAINNLERVTATKSFLGCSGFSVNVGMTTALMNEVAINKMMLSKVTGATYVLADGKKIGEESNFVSCATENIQNLITDERVTHKQVQEIKDKGINVIRVDACGNMI